MIVLSVFWMTAKTQDLCQSLNTTNKVIVYSDTDQTKMLMIIDKYFWTIQLYNTKEWQFEHRRFKDNHPANFMSSLSNKYSFAIKTGIKNRRLDINIEKVSTQYKESEFKLCFPRPPPPKNWF